jgi:hypothetical protein
MQCILVKYNMMVCYGFTWLIIGVNSRLMSTRWWTFKLIKMWGISWLAERLLEQRPSTSTSTRWSCHYCFVICATVAVKYPMPWECAMQQAGTCAPRNVNTEDVRNSASISRISNYAVHSSLFEHLQKKKKMSMQIQLQADLLSENQKNACTSSSTRGIKWHIPLPDKRRLDTPCMT